MLYSASWYESFSTTHGRTEMLFLQNHLKRLLVGVFFLFGFLILDYRRLKRIAPYLIITSILLLFVTKLYYLISFDDWYKPARWLYLGPFSIQTSDIARFSIIIFISYYADKKRHQGMLHVLEVFLIIKTFVYKQLLVLINHHIQ